MIVADPRSEARPDWLDLTVPEAVEQLRLGELSEFFNDFEADPHVMGDCPNCGPVPVHEPGFCEWGCGYDFMTAARVLPVEDNHAALPGHSEQAPAGVVTAGPPPTAATPAGQDHNEQEQR